MFITEVENQRTRQLAHNARMSSIGFGLEMAQIHIDACGPVTVAEIRRYVNQQSLCSRDTIDKVILHGSRVWTRYDDVEPIAYW